MSKKSVAVRKPETALEIVERWAGLSDGEMKRKAAEAENTDDRASRHDLHSLLDSYILTCTRSGTETSPRTLKSYRQGADRLLDWCKANGLKPHKITSKDVHRFIASMDGLKPKSKQLYFTGAKTIHAALRWAGMGDTDPFVEKGGYPISVRNPDGKGKPNPFTDDEVAKLLDGAGCLLEAIIYLGIDAGLRSAEMAGLEWSGVFPETNELEFTGKGRKEAVQYTTNRTFEALDALPSDRVGLVLGGIDTRKMRQIFEDRCEAVGVRKRGLHGLRHTAGTRVYAATKCLLTVKNFLRHDSTIGSEGYAQLDSGEYKKAVHSLEMMVP